MKREHSGNPVGFTLVEILVALVIFVVLAGLGYPALQGFIQRSKIEATAHQAASFARLARLDSIRQSRPARLVIDSDEQSIEAYIDVDEDGARSLGDRLIGRSLLPFGISFKAPGDLSGVDSVDGFDSAGSLAWVTFQLNGTAESEGAFRFGDEEGNFLEVRVAPQSTAQVEIRKWNGTQWFALAEGGQPWEWQ